MENDRKTELPVKEQSERNLADQMLRSRMEQIGQKLLVLSGKGGVGKSTVAANLATALARAGRRVGLLDVDVHGPSIPKLMGLEGLPAVSDDEALRPVISANGVKVMSIGFLLPNEDTPVVWRGPRKYHLIRQFLQQVDWGELDFLIIDAPPGTGDEPLAVAELVRPRVSAVLVTTPQDLAVADVRRSVKFCNEIQLPIMGVLENMSGLACPACGHLIELFKSGGGDKLAKSAGVRFLGSIPIDPEIVDCGDSGKPFAAQPATSPTAEAFARAIEPILAFDADPQAHTTPEPAHQKAPGDLAAGR
jgi:ATP-binding protein involved in chromosome partitioning